jgi:hypothetical protein
MIYFTILKELFKRDTYYIDDCGEGEGEREWSPDYQGLAEFVFLQFCDIENLENFSKK